MALKFNVTILGSSSALPTLNRYPSAHVLNVHERLFLVDCGEGTQLQLRRYRIGFSRIDHIFISHMHGDHVYGIFGLLSTFSLLGRKKVLHIYGPMPLDKIIKNHFSLFEIKLEYPIEYHCFNARQHNMLIDDKNLTVESIPLKHKIPCCGFIFREKERALNLRKDKIDFFNIPLRDIQHIKKGKDFVTESGKIIKNEDLTFPPLNQRSYAYCSDTRYYEKIIPYIKDVDLLYHEATFLQKDYALAKATHHSTASEAAMIANKANVKKLLLGHFSSRYKSLLPHLEEAKKTFENTCVVKDGDNYSIKEERINRAAIKQS